MSNLLFPQIISNYLNSWEGHTQSVGDNFIRLQDRLKTATIEEINIEYNALTQQQLWNESLINLFYEELRYRIFDDTTFCISTTWESIPKFLISPYVSIQVGFEESYPLINGNGSYIHGNNLSISQIKITNDDLDSSSKTKIIRMLIHSKLYAIVEFNTIATTMNIIGFEDQNDRFLFGQSNPNYTIIRIPVGIFPNPDWSMYCNIYKSLRNGKPIIIDPMQDRLINQLVDMDKLRQIKEDGGLLIDGDRLYETRILDEYEEPIEIL